MNQPVQMLPDHVINKIAAGEVIERPASVMKELIENAIDAGAEQVDVEIVRGGMQLIAVSDNGSGMSRNDALLAVERHATSKIQTAEQIEAIATLGFRGEALAAVSAVSRFILITRPAEDLSGTQIHISGGKLQDVLDAGCPPGTRIEVRNLFFNVPARRRFLRSEAAEFAQLRQLFSVYALAHPDIGLSFTADGRQLSGLPAGATLAERIAGLYSPSFANHLRRLDFESGAVKISGYAGLPQTGRKDRSEQYIFVNGRPASAPVIFHALNQAYYSVLARGRYPAAFLFIETDPSLVDVNVHPAKKEVRFRHPSAVRDAVLTAIEKTLSLTAPEGSRADTQFDFGAAGVSPRFEKQGALPIGDPVLRRDFRFSGQKKESGASVPPEGAAGSSQPESASDVQPVPEKGETPWKWCRILGRAGGLYAVLETEDGLVLMDPQAAHERVLFEKLLRESVSGQVLRQGLLSPEVIKLMPVEAEALRRQLPVLEEMGFGVSDFGNDSFLIDALPALLQDRAPAAIISGIAGALETAGSAVKAAHHALLETMAQAACRAAVKEGDFISDKALERLVEDLAGTEMPYTCPHGRPTLIFTSFAELNRKFGR